MVTSVCNMYTPSVCVGVGSMHSVFGHPKIFAIYANRTRLEHSDETQNGQNGGVGQPKPRNEYPLYSAPLALYTLRRARARARMYEYIVHVQLDYAHTHTHQNGSIKQLDVFFFFFSSFYTWGMLCTSKVGTALEHGCVSRCGGSTIDDDRFGFALIHIILIACMEPENRNRCRCHLRCCCRRMPFPFPHSAPNTSLANTFM